MTLRAPAVPQNESKGCPAQTKVSVVLLPVFCWVLDRCNTPTGWRIAPMLFEANSDWCIAPPLFERNPFRIKGQNPPTEPVKKVSQPTSDGKLNMVAQPEIIPKKVRQIPPPTMQLLFI